jgi:pyruvate,water dikinase
MAFGSAQDIEWGCDGKEIYIFQTRNITTLNKQPKIIKYNFRYGKVIGRGISACRGISKGILRIINNNQDYDKINKGDIVFLNCKMDITLVSKIPLLNGLIINGGILSHFAVLAREFNIPCLVQPIFYDKIEDYENRKVIVDAIRGKLLLY